MARKKSTNYAKEEINNIPVETEKVNSIPTEEKIIGYVIASKLNIRKGADINSEIINTVDMGTKLNIKSRNIVNGFYELDNGFVMAKFISF